MTAHLRERAADGGGAGKSPPRAAAWARVRPAVYWLAVVLTPLSAFTGGFASDKLFFLRDLSFQYWPQHLWLRRTLLQGVSPLWDPYVGLGQPAVADPLRHLFFLPTLALDVVLPDVAGFNLGVALPFPVAAAGMYCLLRGRTSDGGALLGALIFACSGPVLATGNMPNLSWSLALTPWILAGAGRTASGGGRGVFALVALLFALQFCAGEAVVLLGTAALAVCYAVFLGAESRPGGERARAAGRVVLSGVAGLLLAAPLALPMAEALSGSERANANPRVTALGSLHPVSLVELVLPFLFGDFARYGKSPWSGPLHDGISPFLVTTYVGAGALALAVVGLWCAPRRWGSFWGVLLLIATVLALGYHTPVYTLLQNAGPAVRALRFPSKFLVFASLALGALAAPAWDAIARGRRDRRARRAIGVAAALCGAVAMSACAVLVAGAVAPQAVRAGVAAIAAALGAAETGPAAAALEASLVWGLPRAVALAGGVSLFLLVARSDQRTARLAGLVLALAAVADPLFTNAHVNPVMPAEFLYEPGWAAAVRADPQSRMYVTSRLWSPALNYLVDGPKRSTALEERGLSVPAEDAAASVQFATFPSAWALRDSASFDNAGLRSREYGRLVNVLRDFGREDRMRALRRLGVRYYVLSEPPEADARVIAEVPGFDAVHVYEVAAASPRAFVAPGARVEPDLDRRLGLLGDPGFDPFAEAILEHEPPAAAGSSGPPGDPSAEIVEDGTTQVTIRATAPAGGGFVVLLDGFDDDWRALVDGEPAPVLRANGVVRAVRIEAGKHDVRFAFEPGELWWGLAIGGVAAVLIVAYAFLPRRNWFLRGA